ncbi:hypothetical protein ACJX0J_034308, partial [Zea mays]
MTYFAFLILWYCHTTFVLNRFSELITESILYYTKDESHIKNIWQQFWRVTSKIFTRKAVFKILPVYLKRISSHPEEIFLYSALVTEIESCFLVEKKKFVVVMHCYFSWNNVAANTHYLFYTMLPAFFIKGFLQGLG